MRDNPLPDNPLLPDPDADADADVDVTVAHERRSHVVAAAQHAQRLDKVLVQLAPEFSRSHLQQLVDKGHVAVDGVVADTVSRKLRLGQHIHLDLVPSDESRAYRPQAMALAVMFEDEHLLVLNKPAGLVVHPAAGHWSGTLLNGLLAYHAAALALPRAGIVHRLDKDTSGLMLVGKTLPAVTALTRAIAAREVHRRYLALVHGEPGQSRFTVALPIGRDPRVRVRMAVVAQSAGGRAARTDFEWLGGQDGQGGLGGEGGQSGLGFISALRCTLFTGRTHQIRVHLSAQGLPLVGDSVYGGQAALGLSRQALHARELNLLHPITGLPLHLVCPLPADLSSAMAAMQLRAGYTAAIAGLQAPRVPRLFEF